MDGLFDDFMVHTVEVQRIKYVDDAANSPSPTNDGPPIQVVGMMVQLSSKEAVNRGLSVDNTYRFTTTAQWPGGPVSSIKWGTRSFNQEGSPQAPPIASELDHTAIILSEIAPEVY